MTTLGLAPDRDPGADAARQRDRGATRPRLAASARLDRRDLESGPVVVVLRATSAAGAARSSTTPAARKRRAGSCPASPSRRSSRARSPDRCRAWLPMWSMKPGCRCGEGVGELVLREPWVGMTNGIWKDPERYMETYWSRFPDTWVHGDYAEIDADGYLVHPRPVGRHAEGGRQADRSGRGRERGRGPPGGARGGGDRRCRTRPRASRSWCSRSRCPASSWATSLGGRGAASYRPAAWGGPAAGAGAVRERPAAHAEREDHAAGDPRGLAGIAPGGDVGAGEPGGESR